MVQSGPQRGDGIRIRGLEFLSAPVASERNSWPGKARTVAATCPQGGVDLVARGAGKKLPHRGSVDAGTGKDFDPPGSAPDKLRDQSRAFGAIRLMAASQDAPQPEVDEFLERLEWIRGEVEGPMEDRSPRVGLPHDRATTLPVDAGVLRQNAEHDAFGAVVEEQSSVALEHAEF